MTMKNYHFYFDEGGIFGNATILITEKRITSKNQSNDNILNYYFGLLPLSSIERIIQLFNKSYPKCKIVVDRRSINITINDLLESNSLTF